MEPETARGIPSYDQLFRVVPVTVIVTGLLGLGFFVGFDARSEFVDHLLAQVARYVELGGCE